MWVKNSLTNCVFVIGKKIESVAHISWYAKEILDLWRAEGKSWKKREPAESKENFVLVWEGTFSELKANKYPIESEFTNFTTQKGYKKEKKTLRYFIYKNQKTNG